MLVATCSSRSEGVNQLVGAFNAKIGSGFLVQCCELGLICATAFPFGSAALRVAWRKRDNRYLPATSAVGVSCDLHWPGVLPQSELEFSFAGVSITPTKR